LFTCPSACVQQSEERADTFLLADARCHFPATVAVPKTVCWRGTEAQGAVQVALDFRKCIRQPQALAAQAPVVPRRAEPAARSPPAPIVPDITPFAVRRWSVVMGSSLEQACHAETQKSLQNGQQACTA